VGEHEGVGEVDEAQSGVVGHADQRLDGVELALVGSAAVVEVVGHAVGPRTTPAASCRAGICP
jgi:hypothetical protein